MPTNLLQHHNPVFYLKLDDIMLDSAGFLVSKFLETWKLLETTGNMETILTKY